MACCSVFLLDKSGSARRVSCGEPFGHVCVVVEKAERESGDDDADKEKVCRSFTSFTSRQTPNSVTTFSRLASIEQVFVEIRTMKQFAHFSATTLCFICSIQVYVEDVDWFL